MAIMTLKKLHIIGHKTIEDSIVDRLHNLGVIQIIDSREAFIASGENVSYKHYNMEDLKLEQIKDKLDKIEYIIKYIEKYLRREGFLESLIKGKIVLSKEELSCILRSINIDDIYIKVKNLEKNIHHLGNKKIKIRNQLLELEPWVELKINLSDISSTKRVRIVPGILNQRDFDNFKEDAIAITKYFQIQEVNTQKRQKYLILFYLDDFPPAFSELLRQYEFIEIIPPSIKATPARLSKRIRQELKFIEKEEQKLIKTSCSLSEYYIKMVSLYDHYEEIKRRYEIRNSFIMTQDVFFLSGWIVTERAPQLKRQLEKEYKEVEIIISEPDETEDVPIILKNSKLMEPFEIITNLYGQPHYYELDPTPYLAPFFFVFWGMCITDAGYGIILMILSYIMIKKFKLQEAGRKFLNLVFLGGIASILWGALLGGWFGINLDELPSGLNVLKSIRLFDPLQNPLAFFIVSLSLGFIQVLSGIAIKMYVYIRVKRFKDALLDELSWLVLLVSILVIGLTKAGIISNILLYNLFIFLGIISALTIVLFKGRKTKNIMGRFFIGILNLLGLFGFTGAVSYMGDIVSYARLFALGLATGALAQAVNTLAKVSFSISFWLGIVLAPGIIVVGHLLNIIINAFGGFIHSCRLQYVEFFTKFFEGGGKVFQPFREQRRYTIIR